MLSMQWIDMIFWDITELNVSLVYIIKREGSPLGQDYFLYFLFMTIYYNSDET